MSLQWYVVANVMQEESWVGQTRRLPMLGSGVAQVVAWYNLNAQTPNCIVLAGTTEGS